MAWTGLKLGSKQLTSPLQGKPESFGNMVSDYEIDIIIGTFVKKSSLMSRQPP